MAFPEYRILKSSELVSILHDGRDSKRFCFILGSGASVESGIPNGSKLEMSWMNCLMGKSGDRGTLPKKPERTEKFAEELYAEKILKNPFSEIKQEWEDAIKENRSMSSEYYFDIYRLRFHPTPKDGYRYLERIMDNCKPSLGYHPLALMLTKTNQHNLVITTNFDSLVEDSLFLYTDKKPLVISHEALANFIDPYVQRPVVAKVHRGLMHDPFNSPDTTDHLEKEWKQPLADAFRTYIPIVIGYAGGDKSLMKALEETTFENGIYWCYRRESGLPDERIQEFVEKQKDGCLVEIEGFDALMMEMGITLFGETISPEETRSHFGAQSDRRMGDYTNQWNELKKIPHIANILEPINKAEEKDREKREEEGTLTYWDHFNKAYDAAEKDDHNTAVQEFTLAIEKDPTKPIAYYNRGNSYRKLGKYDQAIADYSKAIELDPNYAFAYNNRGAIYDNLGKYDQAIADYNKAIELNPNFANAYNCRAFTYAHAKEFSEAIADVQKALSLEPNEPNALHTYGFIYLQQGNWANAIKYFKMALSFNPELIDAYEDRAKAYRALGQIALAEADEAKAKELESAKKTP